MLGGRLAPAAGPGSQSDGGEQLCRRQINVGGRDLGTYGLLTKTQARSTRVLPRKSSTNFGKPAREAVRASFKAERQRNAESGDDSPAPFVSPGSALEGCQRSTARLSDRLERDTHPGKIPVP